MVGKTVRSAVLFTAFAMLFFATAVPAAETVVKIEPFLLVPPEGPTAVVPFQILQPGTVILEITTNQPVPKFGIVARGASGKRSSSRKDGPTPLRMEFKITPQDLERGNTWYAFPTLVAPNKAIYPVPGGLAAGTVKVSFVPARPGPVTTQRVPPPGRSTLVPTPAGAKSPPPAGLQPPPGGKAPPPGTKTPPPPTTGSAQPPSVPPPPPPGTAPPPPASGKYRVTINGIHVNHETWDTALQTDGKGDEIFLMIDVRYLIAGINPVGPPNVFTTVVYGDTNGFPNRIKAG